MKSWVKRAAVALLIGLTAIWFWLQYENRIIARIDADLTKDDGKTED